ncbi:MAG: hypothetical protein FJ044_04570 [Candidatus Cloacimonetes bacterium]|nr:hypothetical protein [Candidatus Cloacimonadota bacterium]
MGLIRVNNPRLSALLKFLSSILRFEFTDGQTRGRYGGTAELFTLEQAREIAEIVGYKQDYRKFHTAMYKAGLTSWYALASRLSENGRGFLTLTEIKNIGRATAIGIVHYGLTKGFLWFEG